MRFVGRGHPEIRATHDKTFELTPDRDITERATCVVAVDVRTDDAQPCAGPVEITLRVNDEPEQLLTARACSSWQPGSSVLVRRSPMQIPGTYATDADTAARDLPRELVAALRSPQSIVDLRVRPAATARPTVVLCAANPSRGPDDRLRAELAVADRVIAEDDAARRLIKPCNTAAPGSRTLVLATRELPGTSALAELADLRTAVETIGLPPLLAAAAASPSRAPLTIATDRPHRALHDARADHRLAVRCRPDALASFLLAAESLRPDAVVCAVQQFAAPVRLRVGVVPELPVDDDVYCCVTPAPAATAARIDPSVRAAIRVLLADGVPTRTAARALAELTGISRRDAYEIVLAMTQADG